MLEKNSAAAELRRIIATLHKILQDKDRFENALYDCFDKPLDVYSLMAGYGYFADLAKKPKAEAAAAQISKKSKIGKDEARTVAEIWIAAKFSGVKDTDAAETVVNKSPQRLAAPVQSPQTLGQDAAAKNEPAAKALKEAAATATAGKAAPARASSPVVAGANKPAKDAKVFYAGAAEIKPKPQQTPAEEPPMKPLTFFDWTRKLLTGKTDFDQRYYTAKMMAVMIVVYVLGFGVAMTAAYFAFLHRGLVFGLILTPAFYLVGSLILYVVFGGRILDKPKPLRLAAFVTPPMTLLFLAVYQVSEAVVYRVAPDNLSTGYLMLAYVLISSVLCLFTLRKKGRERMVFGTGGALLVFSCIMPAYLSLSSAIANLSYGIDGEIFWMALALVILSAAALPLLTFFFRKDGFRYTASVAVSVPVLLLLMQFVSFGFAGMVTRIEWPYSFLTGLILFVSGVVFFRKDTRSSLWKGPLLAGGVFLISALLYLGLFALLYLACRDRLILLAGLLSLALTAAAQFGGAILVRKFPDIKKGLKQRSAGKAKEKTV